MRRRVLIVGQGVAGTALGLELEAIGIDFVIVSDPQAPPASLVAAGLINPITGQRAVKSARFDELRPMAEAFYRAAERTLGEPLWYSVNLRRLWRDEQEEVRCREKVARGALAPYVEGVFPDGLMIAGAARVDLPSLVASAARHWQSEGRWREARVEFANLHMDADGVAWGGERFDVTIWCTGAGRLARAALGMIPFVAARGEILTVLGTGLAVDAVVNRGGHWLLGGAGGEARVGATFEPGNESAGVTATARATLLAAAQAMRPGQSLQVIGQVSGVRLTLPDRLPVSDWHPELPRIGICVGLGSKGALWAPWLARSWGVALRDEMGTSLSTTAVRRFG